MALLVRGGSDKDPSEKQTIDKLRGDSEADDTADDDKDDPEEVEEVVPGSVSKLALDDSNEDAIL
jgi:hypothetical protein